MQPQQQVVMNAVTQQPPAATAVVVHANGVSEETLKMRKKTIFSLGKVELAIGCLMVSVGIFNAIYVPVWSPSNPPSNTPSNTPSNYFPTNYPSYYQSQNRKVTLGEGIWCGIWVIIAGGLGMGAGGSKSTPCLMNNHMAFSIIGSLASVTLCGLAATFAGITGYGDPFYCALMSIFSILSFATAILLIVSASYCCCANPRGCCGGCCDQQAYPNRQYQQHVMHVNAPQVVPGQVQGPAATTATYCIQTPVSQQPGSSNMFYGNPVLAPSTNLPEKADSSYPQEEFPPAYQNE